MSRTKAPTLGPTSPELQYLKGLPELGIPCLDVEKLAARVVGAKSFEETARDLAPEAVVMPRHRAIADARRTARILNRLLRQ